jgi:hypothetical protein
MTPEPEHAEYPPRRNGVAAPEDETDLNRHDHYHLGRSHDRSMCDDWCDE